MFLVLTYIIFVKINFLVIIKTEILFYTFLSQAI